MIRNVFCLINMIINHMLNLIRSRKSLKNSKTIFPQFLLNFLFSFFDINSLFIFRIHSFLLLFFLLFKHFRDVNFVVLFRLRQILQSWLNLLSQCLQFQ
jgi:hypothetical protein